MCRPSPLRTPPPAPMRSRPLGDLPTDGNTAGIVRSVFRLPVGKGIGPFSSAFSYQPKWGPFIDPFGSGDNGTGLYH